MARTLILLCIATTYCNVSWAQETNSDLDADDWSFDACRAVEDASLFKPLGEISTKLPNDGKRLPPDCSARFVPSPMSGNAVRFDSDTAYYWRPTDFFHMPTYFDDVPLERYGQTKHALLQPIVSGTKFFLQVPALPYKMGVDRPHSCVTTLGHRPPGDCVPCIKQTLPHDANATFVQAAATVGLVFLLP